MKSKLTTANLKLTYKILLIFPLLKSQESEDTCK